MKKPVVAVAALVIALFGIALVPTAAFAAGTVQITVEDAAHAPVLGAQVSALTSNGGVTLSPVIGVPGSYQNSNLSAGTYTILVVAPGYARQYYSGSVSRAGATPVVVTDGGTAGLVMTLEPESVISGTITDHSGGPYRAIVGLYSDNEGGTAINALYSDAVTGQYTFPSLPAGDYRILVSTNPSSVESTQWYAQANTAATATVIHLGAHDTQTADIQLALSGTLAGSTTNAVGSPVTLEIAASPSGSGVTSQGGAYSFGGLLPDTYGFTTSDSQNFYVPVDTGAIAITAGTTTPYDIVATPRLLDDAEMLASSSEVAPLSGPSTVEAGGTYTWTVTPPDDDDLYIVLYSSPVLLDVVANTSGTSATFTVTIPASTPAGAHRLAVWAYDDQSGPGGPARTYFPIDVTGATLPSTGVDPTLPLSIALGLLLCGAAAVAATRRRANR